MIKLLNNKKKTTEVHQIYTDVLFFPEKLVREQ